jgi:hypothetical protein
MEMIITARLRAIPYTDILRMGRAIVFWPLASAAIRFAMNNSVFKITGDDDKKANLASSLISFVEC